MVQETFAEDSGCFQIKKQIWQSARPWPAPSWPYLPSVVAVPATQSALSLVAYLAGINFLDLTPEGSLFGQRLFAEFHPASPPSSFLKHKHQAGGVNGGIFCFFSPSQAGRLGHQNFSLLGALSGA
jgi:hypothetical protein